MENYGTTVQVAMWNNELHAYPYGCACFSRKWILTLCIATLKIHDKQEKIHGQLQNMYTVKQDQSVCSHA